MQAIVDRWQGTGRQDRAARIQKEYLESLPTEMERLRTIQAFFCVCKDTDKPRLQAWYINYMMDDDEYISFMMDNDERKQVLKTFVTSAVEADKDGLGLGTFQSCIMSCIPTRLRTRIRS